MHGGHVAAETSRAADLAETHSLGEAHRNWSKERSGDGSRSFTVQGHPAALLPARRFVLSVLVARFPAAPAVRAARRAPAPVDHRRVLDAHAQWLRGPVQRPHRDQRAEPLRRGERGPGAGRRDPPWQHGGRRLRLIGGRGRHADVHRHGWAAGGRHLHRHPAKRRQRDQRPDRSAARRKRRRHGRRQLRLQLLGGPADAGHQHGRLCARADPAGGRPCPGQRCGAARGTDHSL